MVSEELKDEERGIFPVVNNEKEKKKVFRRTGMWLEIKMRK